MISVARIVNTDAVEVHQLDSSMRALCRERLQRALDLNRQGDILENLARAAANALSIMSSGAILLSFSMIFGQLF